MKTFCYLMWMLMLPLSGMAQTDTLRHEVLVETNMGNIRMALFNETPVHRDNFIKMVKEGYYDGILFHRVINRFMIQTGDSTTRHALPGDSVGEYSPPYTLQPEILFINGVWWLLPGSPIMSTLTASRLLPTSI